MKWYWYFSLLVLVLGFCLSPRILFAVATTSDLVMDSASTIGGTGFALDFFGPLPDDVLSWSCGNIDENSCGSGTIVSGTSTVVGYTLYNSGTGDPPQLSCSGDFVVDPAAARLFGYDGVPASWSSVERLHCTSVTYTFDGNFAFLKVWYVPYDTREHVSYVVQDGGNVSFGLTILIVIASLQLVGFLYNSISPKKPWRS